ncbi:MAG: thioredoxin [Sulfurovum sp.]|nr:thioredoxin [Sulfurovum sp.]
MNILNLKTLTVTALLLTAQGLMANEHQIVHLTSSNYLSKLITSKKPVVVKFWAPWCRPCRQMAPEYDKAAHALSDKAIFAELNVEKYPDVSKIYRVRGIPTLIIFKNNKIIKRSTGGMGQKGIETFVINSE